MPKWSYGCLKRSPWISSGHLWGPIRPKGIQIQIDIQICTKTNTNIFWTRPCLTAFTGHHCMELSLPAAWLIALPSEVRDVKYTNTNINTKTNTNIDITTNTNTMAHPAGELPSEIRDVRNTNNTEECFNTPDPRWKKNQICHNILNFNLGMVSQLSFPYFETFEGQRLLPWF